MSLNMLSLDPAYHSLSGEVKPSNAPRYAPSNSRGHRLLTIARKVWLYDEDSSVTDAEKVSGQSVYTAEHMAVGAASFQAAEYQADALVRDDFVSACFSSCK